MIQVMHVFRLFLSSFFSIGGQGIKYILLSGSIALLLMVSILYGVGTFSQNIGTVLADLLPWTWAYETTFYTVIAGLASIYVSYILLKYILLIVLSPLLTYVTIEIAKSKKDLLKINNQNSFVSSIWRSIKINVRNLTKELIITLALLLLGFIPFMQIIAIPMLFLVQAYFVGFGFMDYYLEGYYTFRETITLVYKHKWAAITIGAIITLLMLIPVLGVLIAPYFGTVVSTKYWLKNSENDKN